MSPMPESQHGIQISLEQFPPPLDSVSLGPIMTKLKSGSPTDSTPPQILTLAIDIICPAILDLVNFSISSGTVPLAWKCAMVKALLKKPNLNEDDFANYRPISLLPWVSKILEKHINTIMVDFLESNDLLHPSQTGFCPQFGTETALLAATEEGRRILDQGALQQSSSSTSVPPSTLLIITLYSSDSKIWEYPALY